MMVYAKVTHEVRGILIPCECGRSKLFVWDETPSVADPAGTGRWRIFEELPVAMTPEPYKR